MNPAKRKKLQRLQLTNTNTNKVEEKVIQKEEVVLVKEVVLPKEEPKAVLEPVMEQAVVEQLPQIETEAKAVEPVQTTETIQGLDTKKEKKKKSSSQEV